jgi:hypothetical protein
MGMLAFSIDVGWIALVKTDLQTAADAAALAGAEKLQALYVNYITAGLPGSQLSPGSILTTATTNTGTWHSPKYTAEQFAKYNKAGNISIDVRDDDVSFSFLDANGTFNSNYSAVGLSGFPNSIKVKTRRDNLKNTPVSLFFGPIFGFNTKELEAEATATIYSGDVTSLQVIQGSSISPHILPIALDMNIWNTFSTTGLSADGLTHLAANGSPELYVYPIGPQSVFQSTNTAGSFGLIDVGPPANNSPAFRNWISNGQTPNDINYLISNNLVPVSMPGPAPAPGPKNWKVGPGLTSTLQPNFYAQIGVPNLIPLFIPASAPTGVQAQALGTYTAASGSGQNATYAIVGFAGVMISQADGSGGNMNVSIQPAAIVDPTAKIANPKPAGTQVSQFGSTINSPVITTFISAKLTQ